MEDIREKLVKVIMSLELEEPLSKETILHANYADDKVFNSITFVLLVVLLEEEFGIVIDEEHLLVENLANFESIVSLVERLLGEKVNA